MDDDKLLSLIFAGRHAGAIAQHPRIRGTSRANLLSADEKACQSHARENISYIEVEGLKFQCSK
jgi:hypothetical protein